MKHGILEILNYQFSKNNILDFYILSLAFFFIGTFKVVPLIGFLNQSQRNLVVPCIVPRGTTNNMQMNKVREKKSKINPPYSVHLHTTLYTLQK